MLHQICIDWINNDNIRHSLKIVFGDDNIYSSPCIAGEKVGNLPMYMSSTLQCNGYNNILKHIMGCNALTLTQAM
jgi:hypothetical protein